MPPFGFGKPTGLLVILSTAREAMPDMTAEPHKALLGRYPAVASSQAVIHLELSPALLEGPKTLALLHWKKMNPAAGQSFEAILLDFKNTLTPKECQDFQFVTLRDVQETALRIQKDQENLRAVMGMHRLESFLEAMTQFGKVVEVFANSSIFVAFVWGPLKFILQVGTGSCSSACPFLPIIQTIARAM